MAKNQGELMNNLIFPFTAIVGQEKIKKSLILNAINPGIGGVLIKGDKGTGKTTAVRALADLLPLIAVVKGCLFNCDPHDQDSACELCRSKNIEIEEKKMKVVELPLGSTEDRVVGSIDIKKALKEGITVLEPGILADANRNILYVDEINLLDDHLVDVLLDAAAYGVNNVEREGISISHPSRFILVGTMNPAEGELRPQLADRIGLHITVSSIMDIKDRVSIMDRREQFEKDPKAFKKQFENDQKLLLEKIVSARKLLSQVTIDNDLMELIARICLEAGVDGHRADIAVLKTSKAVAAYHGRQKVEEKDLEEALELVLGDRIPGKSQNNACQQMEKAKFDMEREREKERQDLEKKDEQQEESSEEEMDESNENEEEGSDSSSKVENSIEESSEENNDFDESKNPENKPQDENNNETEDSQSSDEESSLQEVESGSAGIDGDKEEQKLYSINKTENTVDADDVGIDIKNF
jgi:Mg-chelatase subunit ChlI